MDLPVCLFGSAIGTLVPFVFFTGLVAFLTWTLTKGDDHGSSSGYFLAGRQLSGTLIAGSLLLTNLSTEQMVGLNGAAYAGGLHVMVWEVVAVVALVLMALFFLPRFLKSGIATVPQFLAERFDKTTRSLTTIIFLLAYAGILLPIILYSGAMGLKEMIDMGALTGLQTDFQILTFTVVLVGVIGSIYALFGGLRAVAVSDTINGAGLLIGGMAIVYFGLTRIADGAGFMEGLNVLKTAHADQFNSIGGPEDSVPFFTIFTGVFLLNSFYWCTNQQIIQRTFGASNLAEGQKGVLICGALKLLGPLYLVIPGIIAYHMYASDPGMVNDKAYGRLVADVLPTWMVGFFMAVMVGAILSSFNSALNSACTLFSLGVYKGMLRPNASEEAVVRSSKIFGWIIAIAAMVVAPMLMGQDSIFGYLQKMNGLYFIPILAVVVVGMTTKRVPAIAAKTALVVGLLAIASGYFIPIGEKLDEVTKNVPMAQLAEAEADGFAQVEGAEAMAYAGVDWVSVTKTKTVSKTIAGDLVHDFHFLGIVFWSLIGLMLLIGLVAPRAEAWIHRHSGDVDITPWSLAWPFAILLVILVLTIYWYFADFSVLNG